MQMQMLRSVSMQIQIQIQPDFLHLFPKSILFLLPSPTAASLVPFNDCLPIPMYPYPCTYRWTYLISCLLVCKPTCIASHVFSRAQWISKWLKIKTGHLYSYEKIVFAFVFLLVRSWLLTTLIKCLKGQKSLGSLFEDVLQMSLSLSLSLSLSFCWSGHVSSPLWSNVSKVTRLWSCSLRVFSNCHCHCGKTLIYHLLNFY